MLFEEFGLPTIPIAGPVSSMAVDERLAAEYTGSVVDALWTQGAMGAVLWCFTDYASPLFASAPLDVAVHERTFGLWRADGARKPAVGTVSARADRHRSAPSNLSWFDIAPDDFFADRHAQLARLYRRYCDGADGTACHDETVH